MKTHRKQKKTRKYINVVNGVFGDKFLIAKRWSKGLKRFHAVDAFYFTDGVELNSGVSLKNYYFSRCKDFINGFGDDD